MGRPLSMENSVQINTTYCRHSSARQTLIHDNETRVESEWVPFMQYPSIYTPNLAMSGSLGAKHEDLALHKFGRVMSLCNCFGNILFPLTSLTNLESALWGHDNNQQLRQQYLWESMLIDPRSMVAMIYNQSSSLGSLPCDPMVLAHQAVLNMISMMCARVAKDVFIFDVQGPLEVPAKF